MKPTVLILCTGNSCRSHMGEGLLRHLAGDILDVQSAGSKPAGYVHPLAIECMREIGIDIAGHRSKSLEEFLERPVRVVLTVCGNVDQVCPVFPGQKERLHRGFPDPAEAEGTPEEVRDAFRRVRDAMRAYLTETAEGWRRTLRTEA